MSKGAIPHQLEKARQYASRIVAEKRELEAAAEQLLMQLVRDGSKPSLDDMALFSAAGLTDELAVDRALNRAERLVQAQPYASAAAFKQAKDKAAVAAEKLRIEGQRVEKEIADRQQLLAALSKEADNAAALVGRFERERKVLREVVPEHIQNEVRVRRNAIRTAWAEETKETASRLGILNFIATEESDHGGSIHNVSQFEDLRQRLVGSNGRIISIDPMQWEMARKETATEREQLADEMKNAEQRRDAALSELAKLMDYYLTD